MPLPIFIVGNQRSGTTWLSNILCQHSKITGVQSEPFGIRESEYFNCIEGYFGNLKDDNNFIQFIETFGSSDYFRLTGVNKEIFYRKRPSTYVQTFKLLMDTFASKENAMYWLEKSPGHTLFLKKISRYFKNAKFIGIKRNIMDVIKSAVRRNILRNNLIKKYFIMKRIFQHFKYDKHLNHFNSQSSRIILINYEDLRDNIQETLIKLCDFLKLDFESSLLEEKYKPNTSFSNFNKYKERISILTQFEKKIIKWSSLIFKILPYRFYRILYFFQLNTRKRKFHPRYWDMFKREKFQNRNATIV